MDPLYVCSCCGLRIGPADHDGPPDEPSRPCPACRPQVA